MGKVLLVEDDADLAANMQYSLSKLGYSVYLADDGEKGIEMAEKHKPDLIIMDIMLPNMQGDEAVQMLQARSDCKDIPIILLTGLLSNTDEQSGLGKITINGITYEAVAKPFDLAKLLKIIKRFVSY